MFQYNFPTEIKRDWRASQRKMVQGTRHEDVQRWDETHDKHGQSFGHKCRICTVCRYVEARENIYCKRDGNGANDALVAGPKFAGAQTNSAVSLRGPARSSGARVQNRVIAGTKIKRRLSFRASPHRCGVEFDESIIANLVRFLMRLTIQYSSVREHKCVHIKDIKPPLHLSNRR